MTLSQHCSKNIDWLAQTAVSLEKNYPGQHHYISAYLQQFADSLKKLRYPEYDIDLIENLARIRDFTPDSITSSVDSRPQNTSDYILSQIEQVLQRRPQGVPDTRIVDQIIAVSRSKPENAVELINKTLQGCSNYLTGQSGYIAVALDKFNDNPHQTIVMHGLHGLKIKR